MNVTRILLVLALVLCLAGSARADLVARYHFETDANDNSGNGLNGTLVGDASIIWDPYRGFALSLDGLDDYVDCGNDPLFDITDEITVATWIKVDVFDRLCQAIVTKGDSAWRLHRDAASDSIRFSCDGLHGLGAWPGIGGTVNVNDGRWHHVAGVYDGAKLYLYVDGLPDTFVAASGTINTNVLPVMIGEDAEMTGREWNGLIDGVHIYDHALSAEEIVGLARAGAVVGVPLRLTGTNPGPVISATHAGSSSAVHGRSTDGPGGQFRSLNGWGVLIPYAGYSGVEIHSAGAHGVHVGSSGVNGVEVSSAGEVGVRVRSARYDGVRVDDAGTGVYVGSAKGAGVRVQAAGGYGVTVSSAKADGVLVDSAEASGLRVVNAGAHGLTVMSARKGHGLFINSANIDGLSVAYAGRSGVNIHSAGADGLCIKNASGHGVRVFEGVGRDYIYAGSDADPDFRVTKNGTAYADGGWRGAADFAELIELDGNVASCEPGDVLVISNDKDRAVTLSTQPYSTTVIGVYSTKPGFVGSTHPMEDKCDNEIPVAITGLVPCKVSAENGPVKRGELLTSSSTPGHAMRATEHRVGTILGKALGSLDSGTGVVDILVTLQ